MKHVLLILVLLFGVTSVATAGDFETGKEALNQKDYATAFAKFNKAAEAGHRKAQFNLGRMFALGLGVPQDDQEAIRWLTNAAEAGHTEAQYRFGGMHMVGQVVPQNDQEAIHWFRRAAEAGHTEAQYTLGLMYAEGDGVPKDAQAAARWLKNAADGGHAEAQFMLGGMYILGEGVPQNYVQAHRWLNIGAANTTRKETRDRAVSYRDRAARNMSPHQIAEAQKLAREWKPTTGRTR